MTRGMSRSFSTLSLKEVSEDDGSRVDEPAAAKVTKRAINDQFARIFANFNEERAANKKMFTELLERQRSIEDQLARANRKLRKQKNPRELIYNNIDIGKIEGTGILLYIKLKIY